MPAEIDAHYIKTRPSRVWSRIVSYAFYEGRPLTTRGRWINPLVFSNYRISNMLPQMKQVNEPIFILGTGRSGTTILGVVLSMHRDVGYLNEPKAAWHYAFGDEDLIGSYSRNEARYRLYSKDASSHIKQKMQRIYGSYLTISGNLRVVDKYPELIFRTSFVKSIFPGAKFLFLARNGFDTCASIEAWSQRLGKKVNSENHDWWGADDRKWRLLLSQLVPEHSDLVDHLDTFRGWRNHRDRAALEWILTMREGLSLVENDEIDILHIPYEQLCNAPREWMQKICDFTGLDTDETFLSYAEDKLITPAERKPFELESCLRKPFEDTMVQLGY